MTTNILWTGGWDSTFRVLDLVLIKKQSIQPYYILDYRRTSTDMELKTMEKIKQMIYEIDPTAKRLIADTIKTDIKEIPKDNKISEDYQYLASKSHLGDQYDWLARYVKYNKVDNLELCIHRDDKAEGFISKDVRKVKTDRDSYYILNDKPSLPEMLIFSYYRFPLLDMTKLDMEQISKKQGFKHIMEETWFCYRPTRKGEPCGLCNPCKYTIEEGLGRRIPKVSFYRKTRHNVGKLKRKILNKVKS